MDLCLQALQLCQTRDYLPVCPSWGPAPASKAITVTAPNGGESWLIGSNHPITWTSTGSVGSDVKIELLKSEVVVATVITPNDGLWGWTIQSGLATGSDYRIRITSTTNPAIKDTSNSYFTITSSTTTPSITVTTPNGGESWLTRVQSCNYVDILRNSWIKCKD